MHDGAVRDSLRVGVMRTLVAIVSHGGRGGFGCEGAEFEVRGILHTLRTVAAKVRSAHGSAWVTYRTRRKSMTLSLGVER